MIIVLESLNYPKVFPGHQIYIALQFFFRKVSCVLSSVSKCIDLRCCWCPKDGTNRQCLQPACCYNLLSVIPCVSFSIFASGLMSSYLRNQYILRTVHGKIPPHAHTSGFETHSKNTPTHTDINTSFPEKRLYSHLNKISVCVCVYTVVSSTAH